MSTDLSVIVTALVRPQVESRVVNALHDLAEFSGFFTTRVRGQGRGRGAGGESISTESDLRYGGFTKLEIVCAATVEAISSAIVEAAWTARKGDRVLFSGPVQRSGRICELGARKKRGDPA